MSNDVRNLVEDPTAPKEIASARTLQDAASADKTLQGYAAINDRRADDAIAQLAYQFFEEHERKGEEGSAEDDWLRAEQEITRTRTSART